MRTLPLLVLLLTACQYPTQKRGGFGAPKAPRSLDWSASIPQTYWGVFREAETSQEIVLQEDSAWVLVGDEYQELEIFSTRVDIIAAIRKHQPGLYLTRAGLGPSGVQPVDEPLYTARSAVQQNSARFVHAILVLKGAASVFLQPVNAPHHSAGMQRVEAIVFTMDRQGYQPHRIKAERWINAKLTTFGPSWSLTGLRSDAKPASFERVN